MYTYVHICIHIYKCLYLCVRMYSSSQSRHEVHYPHTSQHTMQVIVTPKISIAT